MSLAVALGCKPSVPPSQRAAAPERVNTPDSVKTLESVTLRSLHEKATVSCDGLGIPRIRAASRDDAFRALGYVVARDRSFQMDLLRRSSAGRLAELFG